MSPNLRAQKRAIELRHGLLSSFQDVLTPESLLAIQALARFETRRAALMQQRLERRAKRIEYGERIQFLDARDLIEGTEISVASARAGEFQGSPIPADLQRQWVQGTGPAARSGAPLEQSLRNIAYALLSGADGWMFDGEDACGQTETLSLESQRNLKLAIAKDARFLSVAESVAREMNTWAEGFFKRQIIADWRTQLDFTTKLFRPRGLHLDDRQLRWADGAGMSASIVDTVLYVVNNHQQLRAAGSSLVLYLPKIQTAAEAALWNDMLSALEAHLELGLGTIKTYVLVEQLEASYQLMEIRAALGRHFVGFNTGRWDYINSVADAMVGARDFVHPNIDVISMTYPYMRNYEDRVRRAVNTPDALGQFALWQGGMEPNIPVGSEKGVAAGLERALGGAVREQAAGASGKWVAHWKMVHVVRPVWEKHGAQNQLGRAFERLTYKQADADALIAMEPAARTVRGARDLLSVALQYCNAFEQGMQAAALKPADTFGDDTVLYLMEDMATGEIRMSILWEWLHKGATFTEDDASVDVKRGDKLTRDLFDTLLAEEVEKLHDASDRDVRDDSKNTTLPIATMIVQTYVTSGTKAPWAIDLLNLNIDNVDPVEALLRLHAYYTALEAYGNRTTQNLDFGRTGPGQVL